MIKDIWDKIWRNKNGRVVIWQAPNMWLIGWALFVTLSLLFTSRLADIFSWIGSASLIIWAVLEILKGVNYLRRALGLLVLIYAVATLIKSI